MAIGTEEWLLIIVVVLLLFGATAIPKLARSLGRARGEFNKAKREMDDEMRKSESASAPPAASEDQIRQAARNMGIAESGKPIDEVKRLMNEKMG